MITNNYPVLFIFGLVVYIGIMITIAYFSSKKGSTEGEGYLMGGRNIGLLLLIATSAATAIGTGTSVGATANGFRSGWLGAVYPLANAMGLITVAFCFSHVRKFKFRTLCEELQFYYDGSHTMRKFMSVIIFVVSIIWVGSAINGGANYLSYLIGMPLLPAKVMTVFCLCYLRIYWGIYGSCLYGCYSSYSFIYRIFIYCVYGDTSCRRL